MRNTIIFEMDVPDHTSFFCKTIIVRFQNSTHLDLSSITVSEKNKEQSFLSYAKPGDALYRMISEEVERRHFLEFVSDEREKDDLSIAHNWQEHQIGEFYDD